MLRIGITGGMGTGKETVAGMFADRGALVIDADRIARDAVRPRRAAWRGIVRAFGRKILLPDGRIDRRALGDIVFRDRRKRRLLNAIVHPPVVREMRRRMARAARSGRHPVLVANVPLLFEAGLEGDFDRIVVVSCPRMEQVRRCRARDGLSRAEVERRMRAQLPLAEKRRRADYVVDNGGTLENTERQVQKVWEEVASGRAG